MPIIDPVTNFGEVTVSTGYNASATSIALLTGDGALLPDPSTDGAFNMVWWNCTNYANPKQDPNKEIVRITARSTDTLTITRAQEGTSASTKNTGGKTYKMALVATKKFRDDVNTALGAAKRVSQTWAVGGEIKVPSGDTDFICPMYVSIPSGSDAKLVGARHKIRTGTSATCKLTANGSDITGFTGIVVTPTVGNTTPTAVALSDLMEIALVVTGVSGTPKNLSFTIFIDVR